MDVSAVLLWLHASGIQASCHNTLFNDAVFTELNETFVMNGK
jgi:hypothetical protein